MSPSATDTARRFEPRLSFLWIAASALALGAPFLWGRYPEIPPLPAPLQALSVPGKLTLVTFTDFECPFCRALHPIFTAIEREHGERVAIVRKMKPLPIHPGALPGALAYLCAPESQRERMADKLYSIDETKLDRAGTMGIAKEIGLDPAAFARCIDDPATRAAVQKEEALFDALHGMALPTTYVGPRLVLGYNPDRLKEMVKLELSGKRLSLPLGWMFVLLATSFAAVAGITLFAAKARKR